MSVKPQNAKGTRDFGPLETKRRNYIFSTIKKHFETHGFMQIETPAVENLNVLTGKYGEEGDKLLFKILNSGDYLKKVAEQDLTDKNLKGITPKICDRGLKYDLTVPFARFVAKNQNDLAFPFKRYQIQPVWRADRPQKGRYREFYQCDADVIGTNSLVAEVGLMEIFDGALKDLGITDFSIKLNNRKVLQGLAEIINASDKLTDLTVAIDKLDKIGIEKVFEDLIGKGFVQEQLDKIKPFFSLEGSNDEIISSLSELLSSSEIAQKGVEELKTVCTLTAALGIETIDVDPTLARGLDYYTGSIFEVKLNDGSMGSIGAGGRYDDLTSLFGVKDLSGVGISFGAERIYDVMEVRGLFKDIDNQLDYMFINFSDDHLEDYMTLAAKLRKQGKSVEVYPQAAKMKKQMNYANKRGVANAVFFGDSEKEAGIIKIKDMVSGDQTEMKIDQI